MARKSNKTSHILNLLSGEGAPAEEPEKESAQNPAFSGGTKDTAVPDIPTISIVDHLSNDDDPISALIKENLESQVSLPSEQAPETKQEDEVALTADNSSSSYQEKSENAEASQEDFAESSAQANTHESDEEIALENNKEIIQPNAAQEQAAGVQKDGSAAQDSLDSVQDNRTTPPDTTPFEQNTPSADQQDSSRTSHPSSADVPNPAKTSNRSPIDGHKDIRTSDSVSPDTHRETNTPDSAPMDRHTDAEPTVTSSTSVSNAATKALDSAPANTHESQKAWDSPSANEQNSTQKKEEVTKEDKKQQETSAASAAAPKKSLRYVNVMEHIVTERIVGFMESFEMCTCERCITDATALTLTLLPAKYIVVDSCAESPLLNYYSNKFISQVTVEITKACSIVKNNPHH